MSVSNGDWNLNMNRLEYKHPSCQIIRILYMYIYIGKLGMNYKPVY